MDLKKKNNLDDNFSYELIPIGYYDKIFNKKKGIQSAWHNLKFKFLKEKIPAKNFHLDYGCGPGTFLNYLKVKKKVGIDISKNQIKYAKKHYNNKNTKFISVNLSKIPFDDNTFDSISLVELIEHLEAKEINKILDICYKKLKKNGKIFITTPNYFSFWVILEIIVNLISPIKYHDQHITKFSVLKIKNKIDQKKFKINKLKSFLLISPFVAFISFKLSLKFLKIDSLLTKIIPGHLIYLELQKI